jgi:activator of HSP90 ATPase
MSLITFQSVIESVETLSDDEQDLLFDLIHKRRITKRRQQIANNSTTTLAAVTAGSAKRGSAAALIADVLETASLNAGHSQLDRLGRDA